MKGFPNQISNLRKIQTGISVLKELIDSGGNGKDDGSFGRLLVLNHVAGTGHQPVSLATYIAEQERKPLSKQSHRTTARGLREFYRMLGFIDDSGDAVRILDLGRRATTPGQITAQFWQDVFCNLRHRSQDGSISHPFQILLRLIARKHSIRYTKCALALEARDDSIEELNRISQLADFNDDQIIRNIDVSHSTWTNARKILLPVAIQIGVVRRDRDVVELTSLPQDALPHNRPGVVGATAVQAEPRLVTPETIARIRPNGGFDEIRSAPEVSPADAINTARLRTGRLRRHQAIVQRLASLLHRSGARLYENPFDVVARYDNSLYLFEIKTVERNNPADERDRVREAMAQLCYYEQFEVERIGAGTPCHKVSCFEHEISENHRNFLEQFDIAVIWCGGTAFSGNRNALFATGLVE